MRISLLYRGKYSQWHERFMNYLKEQIDGEAMINSIQNGDQPLPVIAQVSLAGNAQNAPPTLKDPKFWTAEEKKTQKIDQIFHDAIESASENFIENHIDSQKDYDKSEVDHNDSEEKEHLVDKLIRKFNHKIAKLNTFEEQNNEFNEQIKVLNEKNVDLLAQTEVLQDQLKQTSSLKPYVPNVSLEKIIIDLEDEVVSLLEKEKTNLETIESLKSKGFESSENAIYESENQSENDYHVVEKECHKVVNSKVIAPGMFKLSVSQSVSPISMSTTFCNSKNVEKKKKRRKRKSSKPNDKQVNNDVSRANSDFVHFSDLDTFSSVRRPKHSGVIWKKKGSSNTFNVDLSSVSLSKLNKHVKLCDSFDENNLFIFDDESVRISPVSKTPFKKKPRDSMNVRSKSNSNKSLPRTVHRWLPKMQPLAEPVAKWIPRIVQICLWIIDLGCSKHMTGNRTLLTNFVENFLGTVRFGNNDFAVIAGYEDVVIGSMTIKKVYYFEGLGHNLFSFGQFCDKGLEVAFRKSTCFVRNEDGVDLLTGDRSSNLNTIALNKVASNSSTCLVAKAFSS
nr:integrase, catalytic region, zinc finger, CCHC-type, peptidase aspartic, catalytic [Tanacetum cinerariifolium]